MVVDEIQQEMVLRSFDPTDINEKLPNCVEIDSIISVQLYDFVYTIATMHNDNPFHNL